MRKHDAPEATLLASALMKFRDNTSTRAGQSDDVREGSPAPMLDRSRRSSPHYADFRLCGDWIRLTLDLESHVVRCDPVVGPISTR